MKKIWLLFSIFINLHLYADLLEQDPYFKKLIHFDGNETNIATKDFYLSKKRPLSLKNELNATIKAFNNKNIKKNICKYPARYLWLKEHVSLPNINLSHCTKLNEFYKLFNKEDIYLVTKIDNSGKFSSLMGHSFLIFKNQQDSFDSAQMIDFRFLYDENSSKLVNYFKSFTGQLFMQIEFPKFYEYINGAVFNGDRLKLSKLNISPLQKKMIIYHAYELKNTKFYYYYLSKNCVTHINEFLSLTDNSSYIIDKSSMPLESQISYNSMVSKTAYLTLDDYKIPGLKYWDKYTSEKKRKMIEILSKSTNHNAVKKLYFSENEKQYNNYIRNPSSLELRYLNNNEKVFSYNYYDKVLWHDIDEYEHDVKTTALKTSFSLNHGKYSLKEFRLFDLTLDSKMTNKSYNIYLGANRNNINNTLVLNNEIGYGYNKIFNSTMLGIRMDLGNQNKKLYLQPNIFFKSKISHNQYLDLNYLHDYGQSDYYAFSANYNYRFSKNFELGVQYLNNASVYKDVFSFHLKFFFE